MSDTGDNRGNAKNVRNLSDAIRRIGEGECVVDPTIVARLMRRARRGGPLAELADDEVELLGLIAEGHSDQAIGERLGIVGADVGEAVAKVFAKLGVKGSPEELRRIVYALDALRS